MTEAPFDQHFEINQAMLVAQMLLRHDYELVEPERGTFLKLLSKEQALVTSLGSKRFPKRTTDEPTSVTLNYAIARPDVNEHLEAWRPDFVNGTVRYHWSPTVFGNGPSYSGPFAKRDYAIDPFESYAADLEAVLIEQSRWTDLDHFEALLYDDGLHRYSNNWDRIVNDALSGRDDRSTSLLDELRASKADSTSDDWCRMVDHFYEAYQSFRLEHPTGIR